MASSQSASPFETSRSSSINDLNDASEASHSPLQRMELKLLHAYTARALTPEVMRISSVAQDWVQAWFVELPRLAMQHDNLLYALLAFSATQVLATDQTVASAQIRLWSIALKEQREAIAKADHDLEAVVLAGNLMCMTSFGMLRERDLSPYTPPMPWFELAQGARKILPNLAELKNSPGLLLETLRLTAPLWQRDPIVDDIYQPVLTHRLEEEGSDDETARAYANALGVVSSVRRTIIESQPSFVLTRWICTLPQVVPARYVAILQEQRPRALAILLCFWVVLTNAAPMVLRVFGDAEGILPRREIDGILSVLSADWLEILQEPLKEIRAIA